MPPTSSRHPTSPLAHAARAALLLTLACGGEATDPAARASMDIAPGEDRATEYAVPQRDDAMRGIAGAGSVAEIAAAPAAPPPPPSAPPPSRLSQRDVLASAGTSQVPSVANMVIRSGTAAVEVQDLDAALRDLAALAARLGGTVANTVVASGREQTPTATVELRLPPARYDDALGGLAPLGAVQAVNVTAEDVGEEYTDLAARAENARRLEERLVQLLATRTGKLDDVLMVERELARVREEIERFEGRMRYLRARTATSTLAVTLHEPPPIAGGAPGRSPIADAFREAWANVVAVVAFAIAASGVVLPLLAMGIVGWLVVRRLVPRVRTAGTSAGGA